MNEIKPLWSLSKKIPNGYFDSIHHQRAYMEWLGMKLNYKKPEDWYKIRKKDVTQLSFLNKYYGGSIIKAITSLFPEHHFHLWKFQKKPHRYWRQLENQKEFLEWAANVLNIKSQEDWYKIKSSQIRELGGSGLLSEYSESLPRALSKIYPDQKWIMWKYKQTPKGFWNDKNSLDFLKYITSELSLSKLEDWKNISSSSFKKLKGSSLMSKNKGFIPTLCKYFPDYNWREKLIRFPSKTQIYLHKILQTIFLPDDIFLNYTDSKLIYVNTRRKIQLDVYVKTFSIAFEYQGEQYYRSRSIYGSHTNQQKTDEEKKILCQNHGITLIEIPFWWDRKKESLIATINKHRPDVINKSNGIPISEKKPEKNFKSLKKKKVTI